MQYWGVVSSPLASVIFGFLALVVLCILGRHREKDRISRRKIALAFLVGAAFYTFAVCFVGHWGLHIPTSTTIHDGFGDERIAWLFVGLTVDFIARYLELFDVAIWS